jgi:hypothetical protein
MVLKAMAMDTFDLSFDLGLDLWSFIVGKILFLGTVKISNLLLSNFLLLKNKYA